MARYDASNADCFVFTFKEGLMSAVAHDLKLRVGSWHMDVDADAGTLSASFDAGSLRYVTAMKDGRENRSALGIDAKKIEKNIQKDVLNVRKNPTVTFKATSLTASGDGYSVTGDLSLNGVTRSVTGTVTRQGGRLETLVRLNQPDYRIKPYSAMLGALKIKPMVEVKISVPAE